MRRHDLISVLAKKGAVVWESVTYRQEALPATQGRVEDGCIRVVMVVKKGN